MPFLTDQQLDERKTLKKVIETLVTKVEPTQWADAIHQRILIYQELNQSTDAMIANLGTFLSFHSIRTCTGGDNFHGWKDRTVELSKTQRKKIIAIVELMLRTGGRFSEYKESE